MECYSALKRKKILSHATTQKGSTIWFHSYEISQVVKFIETENRMVVTRGCREGKGGIITWYKVSDLSDEKVWKTVSQQCEHT